MLCDCSVTAVGGERLPSPSINNAVASCWGLVLKCFALTSNPSDALVITEIREQYGGPVHLFIGTGHSLRGITIMPFIEVYNIDSDLYELKGHSIFKSVSNTEAS
jgi:hypothetical protein